MKNSAWYHKLWRKKLDELPVKEDADVAWASMHSLLDQHLPVNGHGPVGSTSPKPLALKTGNIIGYLLSVTAIIGTCVYFTLHNTRPLKPVYHKEKQKAQALRDSLQIVISDTVAKDSLTFSGGKAANDTAQNHANVINNARTASVGNYDSTVLTMHAAHPQAASKPNVLNPQNQNSNITESTSHRATLRQHTKNSTAGNIKPKNANENKSRKNTAYGDLTVPFVTSHRDRAVDTLVRSSKRNDERSEILNEMDDHHYLRDILQAGSDAATRQPTFQANLEGNLKGTHTKPEAGTKSNKGKTDKTKHAGPRMALRFNYGLEGGLNPVGGFQSYYLGAFGNYELTEKTSIGIGVRLDKNRTISGSYTHSSYYRPDSLTFPVNDSRKVNSIVIPIRFEHKLSDRVSIHGGPHITYSLKQYSINSKLGAISNTLDTLNHTNTIDSAFKNNSINKVTVGISAGASLRFGHLYIDCTYQQNITPYKVNTGFGTYRQNYGTLQIGLRYMFK